MTPDPKPPSHEDREPPDNLELQGAQRVCPLCNGYGFTYDFELRGDLWKDIASRCSMCRGKGKVEG